MTVTQKKVLDYIRRHVQAEGRVPKHREICEWFEWKSMYSAYSVLKRLTEMGHITTAGPYEGYSLAPCCPFCGQEREVAA